MWLLEERLGGAESQHHRETLFTIGNGYLSTRGTFEEGLPDEWRTTFLHGVFDAAPFGFTELANVPDWTAVEVELDGEHFALHSGQADGHRRLDLRTGELTRTVEWTAPSGRAARLEFRRFASLADPHLAVVTVRVTPAQDSVVEIRVPVAGAAANMGEGGTLLQHTVPLAPIHHDGVHGMQARTVDGAYQVALAVRATPHGPAPELSGVSTRGMTVRTLRFAAAAGETVGVDKVTAYHTSRDGAEPADAAVARVRGAGSVAEIARASAAAWEAEWEASDVRIDGDADAQLAVRFNLFQLLIAAPRRDNQVSIGAKTLSGFGYRGHVFWDTELFMFPFFLYTQPEVARNLLDYRWHRLPQARAKAAAGGLEGAQFPWESADSGMEVTPKWLPHESSETGLVRIWTGDIEIHVSADIAYAAMRYWAVTGDDDWFADRGAEMVLDTARYYAAAAQEDPDGSFHYRDVIGPDEYHEHVDDNAFTNAMARWNLRAAATAYEWLARSRPERAAELAAQLAITGDLLCRWEQVARGIAVPVLPDGRIAQFAGYFELEDVDLAEHEPRTRSMQAIFGIEGANKRQVLKQPDVLMMMRLLESEGEFTAEQRRVNYDYYTPRTDHVYGSSLGPAMQAILAGRAGLPDDALTHFSRAAYCDLEDIRGDTRHGIHGASCGGVWQALVFGFAGLRVAPDGSWTVSPRLPTGWDRLAFTVVLRGEPQRVEISRRSGSVTAEEFLVHVA